MGLRKVLSFLVVLFVLAGCSLADTSLSGSQGTVGVEAFDTTGWTLSWSDEFNGTSVDTSKWSFDTGNGSWGWGNGELEYYRAENATVSGGYLTIAAKKESYGGFSFTSARMHTKGKYSVQYGKIAARIKAPYGKGMWPAFWMLGTSGATWPANGEIDIFEMAGGQNDKMTYSTCHWDSGGHASYGLTYTHSANLSADFHVYEVEWDSSYIRAKFDGVQYYEIAISPSDLSELRGSFYLLLNLAVGGQFFSPALYNVSDITASMPQSMIVDWVRVYKKGTSTSSSSSSSSSSSVSSVSSSSSSSSSTSSSFTYGASRSGTTATIYFKPGWTATWVDVHYIYNNGGQQNFRMTYNSSTARWEKTVSGVASGKVLKYYFTYEKGGLAYDTAWYNKTL